MPDTIVHKPIGFVSSPVNDQKDENWGDVISRIILEPEYVGGLSGLEDFSHAIIVVHLHQAGFISKKHLHRRPQGRDDMPDVGIFSQRVKDRPNPIGITAVSVIDVTEEYLEVRGLDAIDGTPVLDIKPYFPGFDKIEKAAVPDWVNVLMKDYF